MRSQTAAGRVEETPDAFSVAVGVPVTADYRFTWGEFAHSRSSTHPTR